MIYFGQSLYLVATLIIVDLEWPVATFGTVVALGKAGFGIDYTPS